MKTYTANDLEQALTSMRLSTDPAFANNLEQQLLVRFRARQTPAPPVNWFYQKRWGWIVAGLLITALIGLVATPYGRVLAESVIELFRRSGSSQRTIMYQANLETENAEIDQSITEIELQAGFDIFGPSELPGGVYFHGGLYDAERGIAWLDYGVFLLGQQRELDFVKDESMPPLIGPDTVVEYVTAEDFAGQYFQGAWISDEDLSQIQPGETGAVELTWDSNITMETLVWQRQEIVFILIVPGADSPLSGKQTMLDLAQSLAPEADSDLPAPEPLGQISEGSLSYFVRAPGDEISYTFEAFDPATAPAFEEIDPEQIIEAGQLPLPKYLPEGFELQRAFYFSDNGTFTLLYTFEENMERVFFLHYIPDDGILAYLQQEAQQPAGAIGTRANVNQIQLDNGLSSEWVAGEWSLNSSDADPNSPFEDGDQIEGSWDEEIPFYRLRWEQADWLISLEHGGSLMWQLSQEDLVNIANSLQ
jgi:hypothetical protein